MKELRKKNRGGLQVEFSDGRVIKEDVSAKTFIAAIDEAVKCKGANAVLNTSINQLLQAG